MEILSEISSRQVHHEFIDAVQSVQCKCHLGVTRISTAVTRLSMPSRKCPRAHVPEVHPIRGCTVQVDCRKLLPGIQSIRCHLPAMESLTTDKHCKMSRCIQAICVAQVYRFVKLGPKRSVARSCLAKGDWGK